MLAIIAVPTVRKYICEKCGYTTFFDGYRKRPMDTILGFRIDRKCPKCGQKMAELTHSLFILLGKVITWLTKTKKK